MDFNRDFDRRFRRTSTFIEVGIVVVFILVLAMMVMGVIIGLQHSSKGESHLSWGFNGMTEVRCIEGYKFIIGQDGNTKQVLDEFGKGARCNK